MQGGLYRIRVADGSEYGPATEADVCGWITQGRINRDALASQTPGQYVPITQVGAFARAFDLQSSLQGGGSGAHAAGVDPSASNSQIPAQPAQPAEPASDPSQSAEGFLFGDQNLDTGDIFPGGPRDPAATPSAAAQHRAAASTPGAPLPTASNPAMPVGGSPMPAGATPMPQAPDSELTPLPQVDANGQPLLGLQPGAAPSAEPENAAVAQYLSERKDFESACKDLEDGRYDAAAQKFGELAEARPKTSEYLSSATYAELMLATDDKDRFASAGRLREIHDQYPYCVPTLLYLARTSLKIDRPKAAVRYLKSALEIEPDRRDLQRELQRAQDAADGKTGTHSQDKMSSLASFKSALADRNVGGGKNHNDLLDDDVNPKQLIASMVAYGLIFGALYASAVVTEMGEGEYVYDPNNQFWWTRRILLLLLGVGLSMVILKDEKLDLTDFLPVPKWMVAAVGWGLFAGYMSPWQNVTSSMFVVLGMTFFHVLAEEAFFRAFLARSLARAMGGLIAPTTLGAFLFGFYHLTYYEVSTNSSIVVGWSWVGMIALGAGIPYQILYYYSRSLTVPFVCHLLVNGTMMFLSYDHIQQ